LKSTVLVPHQLRIQGQAEQLNSVLWATAAKTGCVIRSLTPSKNSLEQIFLDAVSEGHRADS
jgi:hypothetical protein